MASDDLRRIVLTGAMRGLGRAMAERFAELGHQVLGCGRSASGVEEIGRLLPEPHDFQVVDVSDDAAVKAWAQRLLAVHGSPDLLINNAGLMNRPAALWEVDDEEFARLIDVNLKGVANVIRHFVPSMVDRKSGTIVNFSSTWGRSTSPEVGPYCASKWAVEGLTRALSQELPRGMAAISFNPGIICTDLLRTCWGNSADHYPPPDEWVRAAVPFLLSLGHSHNGTPVSVPA